MNILQKTLAAIFPKRKSAFTLKNQEKLFKTIISALPNELSDVKIQAENTYFHGFKNWSLYPDFKYTEITYPEDDYFKYKKRGRNFKISGLSIFSKVNQRTEEIEILLWDNLIWALKINHSKYELDEFDLASVKGKNAVVTNFEFPARKVDIFYDNLNDEIKEKLNYNDIFDEEYDGKIFYSFYGLEDGNSLAVDEELNVYSIVFDTANDNMISKMETSFLQILDDIAAKRFDEKSHLEERYKN